MMVVLLGYLLIRSRLAAPQAVASARRTLRHLPTTDAGLWLVRALAFEPAAPVGLVLLHQLPAVLVTFGQEVARHG